MRQGRVACSQLDIQLLETGAIHGDQEHVSGKAVYYLGAC